MFGRLPLAPEALVIQLLGIWGVFVSVGPLEALRGQLSGTCGVICIWGGHSEPWGLSNCRCMWCDLFVSFHLHWLFGFVFYNCLMVALSCRLHLEERGGSPCRKQRHWYAAHHPQELLQPRCGGCQ